MLMACQALFRTSTTFCCSMLFINHSSLIIVSVCSLLEMLFGCLARFCSQSFGFRDRRAPNYTTRQLKVVVRRGSAPLIAGCRPAVILFHHRTKLGGHGRTCTAKVHGLSNRRICYSRLTTCPKGWSA